MSIIVLLHPKTTTCHEYVYVYQMHSVVNFFCCNTRLHHHSCNVQDFSCQLQTVQESKSNCSKKTWYTNIFKAVTDNSVTLLTTLIASMSSGQRILICDVPFKNCSDSDIPVGRKRGQTTGITRASIRCDADELFQIGRRWSSCRQSINFLTLAAGFTFS